MANEITNTSVSLAEKTWKFKLERVSKGYVRVTLHDDDIRQLVENWKQIHQWLADEGEVVENVRELEAQELAKLEAKNKKNLSMNRRSSESDT